MRAVQEKRLPSSRLVCGRRAVFAVLDALRRTLHSAKAWLLLRGGKRDCLEWHSNMTQSFCLLHPFGDRVRRD